MGEWRVQVSVRVRPQRRTELEQCAGREKRTLANSGALLLEWGFEQFKQKAAGEIERNGGKVLRVELDYELKVKLYRKLGKAQAPGEGWNQRSKLALADQFRLPVVNGKVAFPDVWIEYANQGAE